MHSLKYTEVHTVKSPVFHGFIIIQSLQFPNKKATSETFITLSVAQQRGQIRTNCRTTLTDPFAIVLCLSEIVDNSL